MNSVLFQFPLFTRTWISSLPFVELHHLFGEILPNIDSILRKAEPSYLNKLLRGFHILKTSPIERQEKRTGVFAIEYCRR